MHLRLIGIRRLAAIGLLIALAGLLASCGSDPTPISTPTPSKGRDRSTPPIDKKADSPVVSCRLSGGVCSMRKWKLSALPFA